MAVVVGDFAQQPIDGGQVVLGDVAAEEEQHGFALVRKE